MTPKRKTDFAGPGCLVQGLGLLCLGLVPLGPVGRLLGPLLAIVLFLIGSQMSQKWICPACNNPLASRDVKVCPSCRAESEEISPEYATPALQAETDERNRLLP